MKKISLPVLLALVFFTSAYSFGQSEEDNKRWMEYMTPSAMQKMLTGWEGTWNEDITMWAAPGALPQKMNSACENKMLLDGRYLQSKHEGSYSGMPFNGISITGYDNLRKVFVFSWIDNFGTGMIYMEGTWDEGTKTMTLSGKMTDPSSGGETGIKQVLTIIDDNTQKLEQFTTQNGIEYKSMEMKLTRKK